MTWGFRLSLEKMALSEFGAQRKPSRGNTVGKVLKVDKTTSTGDRGKFARICVELDLSKPLRGEYILEEEVFKVEYEGLYLICLQCGKYDHNTEKCPEMMKSVEVNNKQESLPEVAKPSCSQGVRPWMVVQKKKFIKYQPPKKYKGLEGRTFGDDISNKKNISQQNKATVNNMGPATSKRKSSTSTELPSSSTIIRQVEQKQDPILPTELVCCSGNETSSNEVEKELCSKISTTKTSGNSVPSSKCDLCVVEEETSDMEIGSSFLLTVVCANPREEICEAVWTDLKRISDNVVGPWVMMGDFNEIAYVKERIGGSPVNVIKCQKFSKLLNDCNTMDLGCRGSDFTWKGPKWLHLDRVYKRLDRICANAQWRTAFGEAVVKSLPRLNSYHNPLLLTLFPKESSWKERPFRFLVSRQDHITFSLLLKFIWNSYRKINLSLMELIEPLKSWNKRVFGCIQFRKEYLLKKLQETQLNISCQLDQSPSDLDKALQDELNRVLEQEEAFWFQKARCKRIADGDRNTRFYHTTTIIRRARKKILELRNDDGHLVREEDNLIELIHSFFNNLFLEEDYNRP
ncbi:uncharacterized protein LOC133309676 [Gastrolobium bilobum]|uniref:uncharacterized protein LOC133309676 n=1 Tax=Gastrolobium bilobum TaxID=150636 RepID=UPI002AB2197D|nr:uncharacterized protein LOC133309676 [Gastrolobium bilobum]